MQERCFKVAVHCKSCHVEAGAADGDTVNGVNICGASRMTLTCSPTLVSWAGAQSVLMRGLISIVQPGAQLAGRLSATSNAKDRLFGCLVQGCTGSRCLSQQDFFFRQALLLSGLARQTGKEVQNIPRALHNWICALGMKATRTVPCCIPSAVAVQ